MTTATEVRGAPPPRRILLFVREGPRSWPPGGGISNHRAALPAAVEVNDPAALPYPARSALSPSPGPAVSPLPCIARSDDTSLGPSPANSSKSWSISATVSSTAWLLPSHQMQ